MNKKIIALLFVLLLCVFNFTVAFAESELTRVVDEADLLTSSEEADILTIVDEISERLQFDVIVVTLDTLDGDSAQTVADDFYDYNGYGYAGTLDGALLLIAEEEREWYISTAGFGITALTDAGIDYIGEQMLPDLSVGDYYSAFITYAELCDEFVTSANNGAPFDTYNLPKEPFDFFKSLLVALCVGVVVAFVVTLIMKGQLKSVRFQSAASNYEKTGSMVVTEAQEFFLYRHVNRQKKAENNSGGSSTHTSSFGTRHGGGGGRF